MKLLLIFTILLLLSLVGMSCHLVHKLNGKIAQLKKAEKKVLDQAELLRFAFEAADAGMWNLIPYTGERCFSTRWFSMLGYTDSNRKFSLLEFKEFIHPEDIDDVVQAAQRYIASGGRGLFEVEFRLLQADGIWCWVRSRGRACEWDDNGVPLRIIGLDMNIQSLKEAQDKVAQSETKLRAIFECAPYAVAINRFEDGRYLDANSVLLENIGLTKEEVLSRNILEFTMFPGGRAFDIWDTLSEMGAIKEVEATVKRKDGRHGHVLCSSVLLNVEGQKQVISMTVDVTGKKHAEEAFAESEKRFRSLFQLSPIPLVEISPDGRILAFNKGLQETIGYTIDEVPTIEHWWEKAYPDPDYRKYASSTWLEAVTLAENGSTEIYSGEFQITCKDGTIRSMIISSNMTGATILVSFFDITERKQEELARMENLELLRATLNATSDGIVVVNNGLKVIQVNRQFYKMWNIPYEMQKNDHETLIKYMLDQVADPIGVKKMRAKLYQSRIQDVREIALKYGRVFECYTAPMEMDEKEIGRVWAFRDISERKWAKVEREKLQQQLIQAQKLDALGIPAGGVAHDLDNMLGTIIKYAEFTMSDMSISNPYRNNLAKIRDTAKRSAALARQLRSFSPKAEKDEAIDDIPK